MYKFKASLANLLVPQLYCAARVFRSCCPDGGFWCDAGERGLSIPCLLQDELWGFSDPWHCFVSGERGWILKLLSWQLSLL